MIDPDDAGLNALVSGCPAWGSMGKKAHRVVYATRFLLAFGIFAGGSFVVREAQADAQAEAGAERIEQAAKAYDEGVSAFDRAEYAVAARAFLDADNWAPSAEALANGLTAAVRANAHLLVVEAAKRTLARESSAEARRQARQAMAFSASKLALLELSCEPNPCGIVVNGVVAKPGSLYVLPGNHELVAVATDGNRNQKQLDTQAGTTYRVRMYAVATGQEAREFQLSTEVSKGSAERPKEQSITRRENTDAAKRDSPGEPKAIFQPWMFFTGAGLSLALAGVTVWSGLDTLDAKNNLGSAPPPGANDDVKSKALRTDILMGASIVTGVLSAYIGVFEVDWGGSQVSAGPGWVSWDTRF